MTEKVSYLVVGYDLSDIINRNEYEEWSQSIEEASLHMFLVENEMAIIDDSVDAKYFIIGHILWNSNHENILKIDLNNKWIHTLYNHNKVQSVLCRLEEIGIVPIGTHKQIRQQIICFNQEE